MEKQKLQRIQKVLASNEDYCNISRLFLDKKCFEVAQYCRSLVEDDPQRKNQVPRELQVETLEPQTEVYRSSLYNYYSGCQHEDSKCERKCGCYMGKRKCDKYCGCDPLKCKNYFTGCRCVGTECRTKGCPCFAANTECDPDLCTICGSCGTQLSFESRT